MDDKCKQSRISPSVSEGGMMLQRSQGWSQPEASTPSGPSRRGVGSIHTSGHNNPVLVGSSQPILNFNQSAPTCSTSGNCNGAWGNESPISANGGRLTPLLCSETASPSSRQTSAEISTSDTLPSSSEMSLVARRTMDTSVLPFTSPQTPLPLVQQNTTCMLKQSSSTIGTLNIPGSNNVSVIGDNAHITVNVHHGRTSSGTADSGIGDSLSSTGRDVSFDNEPSTSFESNPETRGGTATVGEGAIFLIDCCEPMFHKSASSEDNPFQRSIKCALSFITNKAFSNKTDLHGVVFFGTEKKKNRGGFEHVHTMQDLQEAATSQLEELETLLKDDFDFIARHGCNSRVKVSDALQVCSDIFAERRKTVKVLRERIFLFTNNDNPNDPDTRRNAKKKAREMYDANTEIKLMYMDDNDKAFDLSKFYKDVLRSRDDDFRLLQDVPGRFDALVNRRRPENPYKRSMIKMRFSLEGVRIGIGIYNLVCEQKQPIPVKSSCDTEVQNPAKSLSSEDEVRGICEGAGHLSVNVSDEDECVSETLMPHYEDGGYTEYHMEYQRQTITITEEEKSELFNFGESGLYLLGFKPRSVIKPHKPRSAIKPHHQLKCPKFIFPDEGLESGSTRLFSALLQRCLARKKVAICKMLMPGRKSVPSVVALLPQAEELDEHGVEVSPPGFHLVTLPNADNIRKLPKQALDKAKEFKTKNGAANRVQIEKAKELIKKLQFTFRSENYEKPSLKRNVPTADIVDNTAPKPDFIKQRASVEIDEFKRSLIADGQQKVTAGRSKRWKNNADVVVDETLMGKYAKDERICGLTVKTLKEFCIEHRLSQDCRKKADWIREVCGFFNLDPPASSCRSHAEDG